MRVSVTEVETFLECRRRWHFKHQLRLVVPQAREFPAMQVGRAAHRGIEVALLLGGGATRAAAEARAALVEAAGEASAERFGPGMARAVGGVPAEFWRKTLPQVEQKLEAPSPAGRHTFVCKPDFWFYEQDSILLWDFKTTSKDEEERLRLLWWTPQLRWSAYILDKALPPPCPPIYIAYAVLSTRGKHALGEPALMSASALRQAGAEFEEIANEMETAHTYPTYGGHCRFCPLSALCEGLLTGVGLDSILKEYKEEET